MLDARKSAFYNRDHPNDGSCSLGLDMKKALSGLVTFLVFALFSIYGLYESKQWWQEHSKSFTHFALGLFGIGLGTDISPEARYRLLLQKATDGLGASAQEWVEVRRRIPKSSDEFIRNVLQVRASVAEVEIKLGELKVANDYAKEHEEELPRDEIARDLVQSMYKVEEKYRSAATLQKEQIEIIRKWSNDFTVPTRALSGTETSAMTELDGKINSELFDIVVLLRAIQMKASENIED